VETVEAGWNRLWSATEYRPRRTVDDYGEGHAAQRIAELIVTS
jgi:UDP-GlcNAc3NAcA epimerase